METNNTQDKRRIINRPIKNGTVGEIPPAYITELIITIVCKYYGITYAELIGKSRFSEIMKPKKIATKLLFDYGHSYSMIGRMFNTDHSTIIARINSLSDLIYTDKSYEEEYKELNNIINQKRASEKPCNEINRRINIKGLT